MNLSNPWPNSEYPGYNNKGSAVVFNQDISNASTKEKNAGTLKRITRRMFQVPPSHKQVTKKRNFHKQVQLLSNIWTSHSDEDKIQPRRYFIFNTKTLESFTQQVLTKMYG